jgi:large subunit ribosomal protein L30
VTRAKGRAGAKLRIRQVRSGIGYDRRQKATLRALGLARVGKVAVLPDNRQVRGMLGKVSHLVRIEGEESDSAGDDRA